MTSTPVKIPAMGEGITEATITRWLVAEGTRVTADTPIVEIATDKVDSEISAPFDGILLKITRQEGETPLVGEVIALFAANADKSEKLPESIDLAPVLETSSQDVKKTKRPISPSVSSSQVTRSQDAISRKFVPPFVRTLARQEKITPGELQKIQGTGPGGVLQPADILEYIRQRLSSPLESIAVTEQSLPEPGSSQTSREELPPLSIPGRRTEMDRTRKLIARHMVESKRVIPHVTSMLEVDVSVMVKWRESNKDAYALKEKQRLTYTPLFVEAAAKAIMDYPGINIAVDGDFIIHREEINIGIATALEDGNLVVPVIRHANRLNLQGLVSSVNDLVTRARKSQLSPGDISGGTFTITNIGQFGNLSGTPIIPLPQVAILAVGAIVKKPVAVPLGNEYGVAVRDIVTLSLSYDHRVVDGALGASFLKRIADYLEQFEPLRHEI